MMVGFVVQAVIATVKATASWYNYSEDEAESASYWDWEQNYTNAWFDLIVLVLGEILGRLPKFRSNAMIGPAKNYYIDGGQFRKVSSS